MSPDHLHGIEASDQDPEGHDKHRARFAEDVSSATEHLDMPNEAEDEEMKAGTAAHPASRLDDAISLDNSQAQLVQDETD